MESKNRRKIRETFGQDSLKYIDYKKTEINKGLTSYLDSIGLSDKFLKENFNQLIDSDIERRIDELFFGDTPPFSSVWGVYFPEEPFGLNDKLKVLDWGEVKDHLRENSFLVGDNVSYDVAMALRIGKLFEPIQQGPEAIAVISEVYADNIDSLLYGKIPMQRLHEVLAKNPNLGLEEMIFLASHSLSPIKAMKGGKVKWH